MSKYKVKGLPWSSGIGKDIRDCNNIDEVINKANLNYYVEKAPLMAKMPFTLNGNNDIDELNDEFAFEGHVYRNCPNAYSTYRTDKNIPLGLVGDRYEVVQNIDAFSFLEDIIGEHKKSTYQFAGIFGYGERMFITIKIPTITEVNTDRGKDIVDNYLVLSNSHDGSSSIDMLLTPVRVFCLNCLNAALKESNNHIRIRHTKNCNNRLTLGQEVIKMACDKAIDAQNLYNQLYKIKISDDDAIKQIFGLIVSEEKYKLILQYDSSIKGFLKLLNRDMYAMDFTGISMRQINQIRNILDYYKNGVEQDSIIGTGWGLYNAITGYNCNVIDNTGEKRLDYLVYGSGNKQSNNILNNIMKLAV